MDFQISQIIDQIVNKAMSYEEGMSLIEEVVKLQVKLRKISFTNMEQKLKNMPTPGGNTAAKDFS